MSKNGGKAMQNSMSDSSFGGVWCPPKKHPMKMLTMADFNENEKQSMLERVLLCISFSSKSDVM